MNLFYLFLLLISLLSSAFSLQNLSLSLEIVAEFVAVDYLWDETHVRSLYEETGQFVVSNNVITGIKVSDSGDIFVTVPRWMSGVPATLNKLVPNPNSNGGFVLSPWPSWQFNNLSNPNGLKYAQSMYIDSHNVMWVPDVGRINFYDANPSLLQNGPASLFRINVTSGKVLSQYIFPEAVVAYNNTFLNDIVMDEVNGYVYMTSTWANGGIVIFNTLTNQSRFFTSNSTQRNASFDFCVNNICYGENGVGSSPSDGIAFLPPNSTSSSHSSSSIYSTGGTLFWTPVQGTQVLSIPASILWNFSLTNEQIESYVRNIGDRMGTSDGLLIMPSLSSSPSSSSSSSSTLSYGLLYGDLTSSSIGFINQIESFLPTSPGSSSSSSFSTLSSHLNSSSSQLTPTNEQTLNWLDTFSPIPLPQPSSSSSSSSSILYYHYDNSSFYFTTNRLNLFFTSDLDFTGQNGANFRIFKATFQPTQINFPSISPSFSPSNFPTFSPTVNHTDDWYTDDNINGSGFEYLLSHLSPGAAAGVIVGIIILCGILFYVSLKYCVKNQLDKEQAKNLLQFDESRLSHAEMSDGNKNNNKFEISTGVSSIPSTI